MFPLATEHPVYFVGVTHWISALLMVFLARSGLEVLASYPRLYFREDSKPGTEWLNLSLRPIPKGKLWTTLDQEAHWPAWLSLPGHGNLGLGRLWHFFSLGLWVLTGAVYYALLFVSGEWRRLIPTSWSIFPAALHTANTYLHLAQPPHGNPYNPLQQLSYAAVAFIFPLYMLVTGTAMSPGIEARFPWYVRMLGGRQVARSLHFLGLLGIALFVAGHVFLVAVEGFAGNVSFLTYGTRHGNTTVAVGILVGWAVLAVASQVLAGWASLKHPRATQRFLSSIVLPVRARLFLNWPSRQSYSDEYLSREFLVNGYPPDTEEYLALQQDGFRDWKLRVTGLVEEPLELSLDDLRAMPGHEQTTLHNCIQGWSGYAKWKGVCMSELLRRCRPKENARYAIFYTHQWFMGRQFYEALEIELMHDAQTILAYEMNGEPLPVEHGAPLRLRVENVLGYKMAKYLCEIELVESFERTGQGMGGHREDNRYYGHTAGI